MEISIDSFRPSKQNRPKSDIACWTTFSPQAPLEMPYFGFTRPKLFSLERKSQVRNPHKLRAGATIWELLYSNCAWKCIAK
jgi:hypothetical protein